MMLGTTNVHTLALIKFIFMKKVFTLLLLSLALSSSNAQYLTITDSNAIWSVQQWKYFSTGDTTIGANSYIKITVGALPGFSIPLSPISYLIRSEANGKNYSRPDTVDYLIYDFSLNAGDTGTAYMPSGGPYGHFEVDSTDVISMAGANRKVMYIHNPMYNFPEVWIEGIGTMNGFGLSNYPLTGIVIDFSCFNDPFLLCYHENGVKLFQNVNNPQGMWMYMVDSCYWICTQGINTSGNPPFLTYPNPVKDILQINGVNHNNYSFRIINTIGQQIYCEQLTVFYTQLDVSDLEVGVYFLEITDQGSNMKRALKFSKIE